jgi:hypothetical protein
MTDEIGLQIANALLAIAKSIDGLAGAVDDVAGCMPQIPLTGGDKGIAVHCENYVHKG